MYQNDFQYYPYQGYQMFENIRPGKGLSNLFRRNTIKSKFNWSELLNNTQKTLNVINQAIPIVYQIKPIWNNAKTMFKIIGAIKEDDKKIETTKSSTSSISKQQKEELNNSISLQETRPTFFL